MMGLRVLACPCPCWVAMDYGSRHTALIQHNQSLYNSFQALGSNTGRNLADRSPTQKGNQWLIQKGDLVSQAFSDFRAWCVQCERSSLAPDSHLWRFSALKETCLMRWNRIGLKQNRGKTFFPRLKKKKKNRNWFELVSWRWLQNGHYLLKVWGSWCHHVSCESLEDWVF